MPTNYGYKLPTLTEYLKKKAPTNIPRPMSFPLPNVSSILNPSLATPPFVDPTIGETPDLSVPNELPRVFGGAMPKAGTGEESKGGGKREMLANIFNAIASGAAIFGSQNPGEMLASQLENQAQRLLEKRRLEAAQQAEEAQREFQKAMAREEAESRRQEIASERQFKQQSQREGFAHDIKLTSIKFEQDKALQAQHDKTKNEFEQMQREWQVNVLMPEQQKYAIEMENLRTTNDIRQQELKSVQGALLNASKYHQMVPISKVRDIMYKYTNGIAFTADDEKTINTARRINAAELSGGRIGGQPLQRKNFMDIQKTENDLAQQLLTKEFEQPLKDTQGNVIINPQTGQPRTYKTRMSAEEVMDTIKTFRTVTGYDQLYNQFVQGAQPTPKGVAAPEQQILFNISTHIQQGKDPRDIDVNVIPDGPTKEKVKKIIKKATEDRYKNFVNLFGK